jgi:hypothetical protein
MFSSFFIQSINGLTTGFIFSGKWFNSTTALDNEHCTLKLLLHFILEMLHKILFTVVFFFLVIWFDLIFGVLTPLSAVF